MSKLGSGSLLTIGQEHLVIQSPEHVMFVSVGESDKQHLMGLLKKGDNITIMGKQNIEEISPGHTRSSAEVFEVIKDDGTVIALNH